MLRPKRTLISKYCPIDISKEIDIGIHIWVGIQNELIYCGRVGTKANPEFRRSYQKIKTSG